MDFTTAKEVWDVLKTKYENHISANVNRLWNEFDAIKMLDDEKMAKYIARVKSIVRELKNVWGNVPDSRWTNRLVSGFP